MAEEAGSKIINILLLGETGVGKSTLINACANYLTYNSFADAFQEPICLIPTKFAFTDRDQENKVHNEYPENYDENNGNENMEFGQSGTLSCMSYVFPLEFGTKIRWIDTSGFGDTQGSGKDVDNLVDILEYAAQFRNIHVIAVVCKADANRLSRPLENDLQNLFKKLGNNAFKNVVMIFSHGHKPAGAMGVMKEMFGSIWKFLTFSDELKFTKTNVFCFENKPFRELLIAKETAQISDADKAKNERDWNESKMELMRLISSAELYLEKPFDTDHLLNSHSKYTFIRNMCVISGTILLNLRENLGVLESAMNKTQDSGNVKLTKLSVESSDKAVSVCLSKKCLHKFKFSKTSLFDAVVCCPGCEPKFKVCKQLGAVTSKCDSCGCSRDHHDFIYYKIKFEDEEIPPTIEKMQDLMDGLKREEDVIHKSVNLIIKHVEDELKEKKSLYSETKCMASILRDAVEHLKDEPDKNQEEISSISMIKAEVQNLEIYGKVIKEVNRATKNKKKEDKAKRDKKINTKPAK